MIRRLRRTRRQLFTVNRLLGDLIAILSGRYHRRLANRLMFKAFRPFIPRLR